MRAGKKRKYPGTLSPRESSREREHRILARKAAAEGMVLLENHGALPLKKGEAVALYGGGARHTIKGGTGSGAVNNRDNVSIEQGLKHAGVPIATGQWLDRYDAEYQACYEAWKAYIYELTGGKKDFDTLYRAHASNPMQMPKGEKVTAETKADARTAVFVISRVSGEGADRKAEKGDYFLSDQEHEMLADLTALYEQTVVILNVGGIMDLSFLEEFRIDGLVLMSQAGMEGGNALADVLTGAVCPSGKLTDTWPMRYEDVPFGAVFSHNNGNVIEEKYSEGIYVGYRYYDTFEVKPRYAFGYGLSYTAFTESVIRTELLDDRCRVTVQVENTGSAAGKQVVQLYASCPSGVLKKERKRLVAFGKTELLEPGECRTLCLEFALRDLASYRTGKAAYVMEAGMYYLLIGTAADQVRAVAALTLAGTVVTEQDTNICPLLDALTEIQPDDEAIRIWEASMEAAVKNENLPILAIPEEVIGASRNRKEIPDIDPKQQNTIDGLLAGMTPRQKAELVCGKVGWGSDDFIGAAGETVPGSAGETVSMTVNEEMIDSLVLADGPAGLRLQAKYEVNPEDGSIYRMTRYERLENRIFQTEYPHEGSTVYYQYCSAVPVGTLLAQTFDPDLLTEIGVLIGREMEEFGVDLWLAPGMNIHRNPLCGRNFEYYSEDPLISGRMAAAITKGVQRRSGLGTTIKHFACNNQEENRRGVSSIVSERALREIYLKGFETAVKEAQPMAIMTSYNKINGVHTANSFDLCTTAAREEWGFQGIIMTDWTTTNFEGGSSAAKCIAAGNDLVMPGTASDISEIVDALTGEKDQYLPMEALDACAARILKITVEGREES